MFNPAKVVSLKDYLKIVHNLFNTHMAKVIKNKNQILCSKQTLIEDFGFVQNLNLKDMNGYFNYYIAGN